MPNLPAEIEDYRDEMWRRDEDSRVETWADAEKFIAEVGFCAGLTDARKPLPSLYIAVCARREVVAPKNVQKDVEMSAAWLLKDEILRRGAVYYGKVVKQSAIFIAPDLIASFNALFGVTKNDEAAKLSANAQKILAVLRQEWESASADLRQAAAISDRAQFNKAMDELQSRMKIVPSDCLYEPKFTYVWTLAEARFGEQLSQNCTREVAVTNIARAYLNGAGQTSSKELAKNIGLSPLEANLGFLNLVEQTEAVQIEAGVFRLAKIAADEGV